MKKVSFTVLILILPLVLFAGTQQTSGTTAATIISQARAYLNSSSSDDFFPEAEMLQWLNDGQLDIQVRSHCLQDTEEITLVANQLEYTVTADYVFVKSIHYIDADGVRRGLQEGRIENVGNAEEVSHPRYWYDWEGKIGVFPVLSSVTTEKIILYIAPRPATITASQTLLIPAIYESALVKYIAAQAWAKDRHFAKARAIMASYVDEVNRLRTEFVRMPGDKQ